MKMIVFVLIAFCMLVACAPMQINEIPNTNRTLEIGGNTFDRYTLWGCREYLGDVRTILELVTTDIAVEDTVKEVLGNKDINEAFKEVYLGYILFD